MKYKKILSTALVLLIAGLVCMFTASMLVGFNWDKLSNEEYTEHTRTFNGQYDSIYVEDSNLTVKLIPTDGEMKLVYYESEDTKYTITEENSMLYIKKNTKIHFFWFSFDFFTPNQLLLYVPENYTGDVTVKNSNGGIDAEGFNFSLANFKTSNAPINVIGCSLGDVQLNSSNGAIVFKSSNASQVRLSTSNARIEVENVTASKLGSGRGSGVNAGVIDVKSSNGSIRIADVTADTVIADTSNATVTLENVSAMTETRAESSNGDIRINTLTSRKLYAKTSNSKITFDNIDCLDIDMKSSNGDITGTLVGRLENYTITSHTSNGDTNLPNGLTSGNRRLTTKTSNADINVFFDNTDGCF